MDGWEFLFEFMKKFEAKDYVAFITIPCGTLLILAGKDGTVGAVIMLIAAAYFSVSTVKKLTTP